MTYAITVETVTPRLLAAARGQARIDEIGQVAMPLLDSIYAFLKTHEALRKPGGHNVFLYHHPSRREDPMQIDFGVEIAARCPGEGGIACVETPSGLAARTLHVGPYSRMHPAHQAIHDWCRNNNRPIGAMSWEVYGDWTEDESKLETEIFYLLR